MIRVIPQARRYTVECPDCGLIIGVDLIERDAWNLAEGHSALAHFGRLNVERNVEGDANRCSGGIASVAAAGPAGGGGLMG